VCGPQLSLILIGRDFEGRPERQWNKWIHCQ
jgi:hypothetical protein